MFRRIALTLILLLSTFASAQTPNRVTILYDSFGTNLKLTADWGFAALVEYGGKRVLFEPATTPSSSSTT